MKNSITVVFIVLISLLSCSVVLAGGPPPPGGGMGPVCWPTCAVPIDGGVTFLLIAGAAYGSKKIHDLRKEKSN